MNNLKWLAALGGVCGLIAACEPAGVDGDDDLGDDDVGDDDDSVGAPVVRSSSASYDDPVLFSGSQSSAAGAVYEVLPGPAVLNPAMDPTPFSNNTAASSGSYSLKVLDVDEEDSEDSGDAVTEVDIRFVGSDGTEFLIDAIDVIHKPMGMGDHSFFGGVGLNVLMHGDTGLGTAMMPKMLAYVTLWGIVDLKDAATGDVLAAGRLVHIMTATRVRDENRELALGVDSDESDHDFNAAETHVILPPLNMAGEMDPVPGTAHGFLHMMYENVELIEPSRDPTLAYEILPGPAAINPAMDPTPFSDRVSFGSGSYSLSVRDVDSEDSEGSEDSVEDFALSFSVDDGASYTIDGMEVIHKANGSGDHSFFGGVGIDETMHGDSGLGTPLMPKMNAYITVWGKVDLMDGAGTVVAADRLIHVMVTSRARTADLKLITDVDVDSTDPDLGMVETHIILPPLNMAGEMDPVPGTRHGFLHLMFEHVQLSDPQ